MATIAITVPKNLREKLGDEGAQEFVSVLNQINTAQLEEMERLNGRTFEKFQQELAHTRDLLSNQIERSDERHRSDFKQLDERHRSDFKQLDERLKQSEERLRGEIRLLHGEFEKIIAQRHADMLKWMFIFWATATSTIVAGYFLK